MKTKRDIIPKTFRFTKELNEKLIKEAKGLGIPANALVIMTLNNYFDKKSRKGDNGGI